MSFKSKTWLKRQKIRVAVVKFRFIKISNWLKNKMLLNIQILKLVVDHKYVQFNALKLTIGFSKLDLVPHVLAKYFEIAVWLWFKSCNLSECCRHWATNASSKLDKPTLLLQSCCFRLTVNKDKFFAIKWIMLLSSNSFAIFCTVLQLICESISEK